MWVRTPANQGGVTFYPGPTSAQLLASELLGERTEGHDMLPVIWVTCGAVLVVAAVRSRRHPASHLTGRVAFAVLYLGGGAAGNGYLMLQGEDYGRFAEGSPWSFVRETWVSLVVPNRWLFIGLLIVFEAMVGLLALAGGRRTQAAYVAAILFHVALLSFGWGFALWSVPVVAALGTLLRREREQERQPRRDNLPEVVHGVLW